MTSARIKYLEGKKAHRLDQLKGALVAGSIYNVDYKEIKEDLNRVAEAELHEIVHSYSKDDHDSVIVNGNIGPSFYLHTMAGQIKKLVKLTTLGKGLPNNDLLNALLHWHDVHQQLESLKPNVVIGRKPNPDGRIAPVRTLENTGSCAVCSQNVKLIGSEIFHHGYKVFWSQRNGSCFGTSELPWEVSPEGLIKYISLLEAQIVRTEARLAGVRTTTEIPFEGTMAFPVKGKVFIDPAHSQFETYRKQYAHTLEYQVRNLRGQLEADKSRVAKWTAQPLPGASLPKTVGGRAW